LETVIYITECAGKYGDAWIENSLREANQAANPLLYRIAFKMATGSGKTLVIAMLIGWQTLNKSPTRRDKRFSDAFLIAPPGSLFATGCACCSRPDHSKYYRQHDLVPVRCTRN
jgi:type III restriction enzyme